MLRRIGSVAVSQRLCSLAGFQPARQTRLAAQQVPTGDEDWMDFDDGDFWFLDEMFEGRLETPEFLPDGERKLLEREGLDETRGPK